MVHANLVVLVTIAAIGGNFALGDLSLCSKSCATACSNSDVCNSVDPPVDTYPCQKAISDNNLAGCRNPNASCKEIYCSKAFAIFCINGTLDEECTANTSMDLFRNVSDSCGQWLQNQCRLDGTETPNTQSNVTNATMSGGNDSTVTVTNVTVANVTVGDVPENATSSTNTTVTQPNTVKKPNEGATFHSPSLLALLVTFLGIAVIL